MRSLIEVNFESAKDFAIQTRIGIKSKYAIQVNRARSSSDVWLLKRDIH